ncbi:cation diffusion facilitator family transporter [Salsuginibacillus halophilus]|nr:cation transporter [Salsuginibacillus halophilus]
MENTALKEKSLLVLSVWGALIFAVVAIVWGIAIQSQMLLFDGVYSFLSVGLSAMSLLAAKFVSQDDERKFPFGKAGVEPLVLTLKYTAIAAMCIYAIAAALTDLFAGGRDVSAGPATVYALLATIGCWWMYRHLHRKNQGDSSNFVRAEANQWLMDTYLSLAVLIGFSAAVVMSYTALASWTVYVDPVMVLIAAGYFLKVPIEGIRESMREVLSMAPQDGVQERVEALVEQEGERNGFEATVVRTSRVGRRLYVEVDYIVGEYAEVQDIRGADVVRSTLYASLKEESTDLWLTVSFTHDAFWAE